MVFKSSRFIPPASDASIGAYFPEYQKYILRHESLMSLFYQKS